MLEAFVYDPLISWRMTKGEEKQGEEKEREKEKEREREKERGKGKKEGKRRGRQKVGKTSLLFAWPTTCVPTTCVPTTRFLAPPTRFLWPPLFPPVQKHGLFCRRRPTPTRALCFQWLVWLLETVPYGRTRQILI